MLDLWPARKTAGHAFDERLIEADRRNELHIHKDGTPGQAGGLNQEKDNDRTQEALDPRRSDSAESAV